MWFGTEGGISRYDDQRLLDFTSRDGLADPVLGLAHDAAGVLWFSTEGGVYRLANADVPCDDGAFTHFTTKDGLAADRVRAIASTPEGLLCATDLGPCRYDGSRWVADEDITGNYILSFLRGSDGTLWYGTTAGVLRSGDQGIVNYTSYGE